jgi:hypothetical protein
LSHRQESAKWLIIQQPNLVQGAVDFVRCTITVVEMQSLRGFF